MRYKIFNLDQQALIDLDLGVEEALVLDHFLKFKDSNRMKRVFDEELQDQGYWLSYDAIIKDLPILFKQTPAGATKEEADKILKNNKAKVARILKSLSNVLTMKKRVKKTKGALGSEMYAFLNRDAITKLLNMDREDKKPAEEPVKEVVEEKPAVENKKPAEEAGAYKDPNLRCRAIEALRTKGYIFHNYSMEEQEQAIKDQIDKYFAWENEGQKNNDMWEW